MLTDRQKQAMAILQTVRGMKKANRPVARGIADQEDEFAAGMEALMTFQRGTGRKMDDKGNVVPGSEFSITAADLYDEAAINKLGEIREALPADKRHLLDELYGASSA